MQVPVSSDTIHPACGILYHMSTIQEDPNPADRFQATTLEAAQQNTRFAVDAEVKRYNASKAADYEAQWLRYVAARDARLDADNLVAPVPAYAEAVFTDRYGWPFIFTTADKLVATPHVYVPPQTKPSTGGFGALLAITPASNGLSPNELLAAKVYGEPLAWGTLKFLRIA